MKYLNDNKDSRTRACSGCNEIKPLDEFSYRSTEQRYESRCKSCRRTLRKRKSSSNEVGHDFGANNNPKQKKYTSNRIIESRVGMTNAQLEAIDFSYLENRSGAQFTYVEKNDVVQRFNEFIELLREGYSEIRGVNVFIRKN